MFDSVDTANDCIRIATGVLSTIRINPDRMLAGLSPDMLATDLAEYLVRKGARYYLPYISPQSQQNKGNSKIINCLLFCQCLAAVSEQSAGASRCQRSIY